MSLLWDARHKWVEGLYTVRGIKTSCCEENRFEKEWTHSETLIPPEWKYLASNTNSDKNTKLECDWNWFLFLTLNVFNDKMALIATTKLAATMRHTSHTHKHTYKWHITHTHIHKWAHAIFHYYNTDHACETCINKYGLHLADIIVSAYCYIKSLLIQFLTT